MNHINTTITIKFVTKAFPDGMEQRLSYPLIQEQALKKFYDSDYISYLNVDPELKIISIVESNANSDINKIDQILKYLLPCLFFIIFLFGSICSGGWFFISFLVVTIIWLALEIYGDYTKR